MEPNTVILILGLGLNALTTFGALVSFRVHMENRLTRLETMVDISQRHKHHATRST